MTHKFYLRDKNKHPITLVAYELSGGVIRYTTATQHPNDHRPDMTPDQLKLLPHIITEGRLRTNRKVWTIFHLHEDPMVDITTHMFQRALDRKRTDTKWAAAAKYYILRETSPRILPQATQA